MLLNYSVPTGVVKDLKVLLGTCGICQDYIVVTRLPVPQAYILTAMKSHEKKWPGSSSRQVMRTLDGNKMVENKEVKERYELLLESKISYHNNKKKTTEQLIYS